MQIAWSRRGELIRTLSLILVPGLILILITRFLAAGSDATIINGYVVLPTPLSGFWRFIEFILVGLTWTWAVSAGLLAVLGRETSPLAAVKQALRELGQLSSGRVTRTVLTVGGGVVAPAGAVYWLASPVQEWLSEGWMPGAVASVVAGLLLAFTALALTAVQAATLGSLFTDAQLTKQDKPLMPTRWRTAAVAGLIAPAVLMAGVVVANPFDRPQIRANEMRLDEVYGAGWPAGQHPVILTTNGFLDCQDDECRTFYKREFRTSQRPAGLNPLAVGTSAVTPTGVVLRALAEQSGQIALQRCTRTGTCETGTAKMPAFQAHVRLAIAEAADGAIYLATAHDLSNGKFEQALIRCPNVSCTDGRRQTAGTYNGNTGDLAEVHLGLSAQGLAQAIFGRGAYGEVATCDSVSCGQLELTDSSVGSPLAAAVQDPQVQSMRLLHNVLMPDCGQHGCEVREHSFDIDCCLHGEYKPLALAAFGNVISAVIVQPAGSTRGTQRQTVLWQCLDVRCTQERKLPLQITQSIPDSVFLAANPDGRLLIVQSGEQDFVYTVAAT